MENSSCCQDKGLAPKKGRRSSSVHHRPLSPGFGFSRRSLLPLICVATGMSLRPAAAEATGGLTRLEVAG